MNLGRVGDAAITMQCYTIGPFLVPWELSIYLGRKGGGARGCVNGPPPHAQNRQGGSLSGSLPETIAGWSVTRLAQNPIFVDSKSALRSCRPFPQTPGLDYRESLTWNLG